MNDFTASNGVTLSRSEEGHVILPPALMGIAEASQQALREMFRAEDDERLERWRWPEDPDYVVYLPAGMDHYVRVFSERDATTTVVYRDAVDVNASLAAQAALDYFDAHPAPQPAWHDAKRGEVWIVDTHIRTWGGEQAMFVSEDRKFHNSSWSLPVNDPDVRSARRIWPEVSDGD